MAARHADWVVGYADEVWWSRLAQPAMHAWGETLRLHAKARAKDDPQPKALACYGLLRTDQDRVLLRFVEGRPVSRVTTDFLAWGADRLAAEGKRVWVLVWDNAAWHVSRAVRAWIGAHNRTVKRTGGVRILVCRLPVKSPWLNPIEPRWLHGKRAIVEPERTLTAHELMDRVHQHFGCEPLEPLHQHVLSRACSRLKHSPVDQRPLAPARRVFRACQSFGVYPALSLRAAYALQTGGGR